MTNTKPSFKLYPEEQRWWSFQDYQAVLNAMKKTGAKRVLEFGPGSSTLALIEGGAESVDTLEDQEDWAQVYEERLAKRFPEPGWPTAVRLHRYEIREGQPLSIAAVDAQRFDLALIDGPRGTEQRSPSIRYALDHATHVLVACEEWETKPMLRPIIQQLAKEAGRSVTFKTTGPLSGAFALIGPKPEAKAAPAPKTKTPAKPKATGKKK